MHPPPIDIACSIASAFSNSQNLPLPLSRRLTTCRALHNRGMNWGSVLCNVHTVNLRRLGRMVSEEVNNITFVNAVVTIYRCLWSTKGYSDDIKQQCLKLYVNGIGFRAIERSTGVHHTTIINGKQIGEQLPDAPEKDDIPEVGVRWTRNFVVKKNKIWLWTAVNHFSKVFWLGC